MSAWGSSSAVHTLGVTPSTPAGASVGDQGRGVNVIVPRQFMRRAPRVRPAGTANRLRDVGACHGKRTPDKVAFCAHRRKGCRDEGYPGLG
jgi:hypothetical protein